MFARYAEVAHMVIDTDVLIWYMRGNPAAHDFLEQQSHFSCSVVTYMEIVQGMRNQRELQEFRKALRTWQAIIIQVNEAMSFQAQAYIEQYYLSHALQLADALIAATAAVSGLPLHTGNVKHYRMIPDIEVHPFRPTL